jgi:cold shock CspA family protein
MSKHLSENIIVEKLLEKCDIEQNPNYGEVYKLDFVISKFNLIDKMIPLGVQVTLNEDDDERQRSFLRERLTQTLVDRSIYVKVSPQVNLNTYGVELIYSAIVAFAFQKDMRRFNVMGVKINADITYEFFMLGSERRFEHMRGETVAASREAASSSSGETDARDEGADLDGNVTYREGRKGKIIRYFPSKGFGFVQEDDRDFFFHISDVEDEDLRDRILPAVEIDFEENRMKTPIDVVFSDVGYTRPGADKPTARALIRPFLAKEIITDDIDSDEDEPSPGNELPS